VLVIFAAMWAGFARYRLRTTSRPNRDVR
jgi:hypothetical protein